MTSAQASLENSGRASRSDDSCARSALMRRYSAAGYVSGQLLRHAVGLGKTSPTQSLYFAVAGQFTHAPPRLHRPVAAFVGADAPGVLHGRDEDFADANLAGLGRLDDGFHRGLHLGVRQHRFDFYLRQEIHRVFAAAINLRVPLLATEALGFRDGKIFVSPIEEAIRIRTEEKGDQAV